MKIETNSYKIIIGTAAECESQLNWLKKNYILEIINFCADKDITSALVFIYREMQEREKILTEIIITDLPKVSLNKWYAGEHWGKRKNIKDIYKVMIKSQTDIFFPKAKYLVSYDFYFKKNPLDASNCVAMLKLIEDVLFKNDKWDLIKICGIESFKGKSDKVIIKVEERL